VELPHGGHAFYITKLQQGYQPILDRRIWNNQEQIDRFNAAISNHYATFKNQNVKLGQLEP
jgi:hypothetical protein